VIYSDSKIAINRIKQRKCPTKLKKTSETKQLYQIIDKALLYLKNNQSVVQKIKILKRDTAQR